MKGPSRSIWLWLGAVLALLATSVSAEATAASAPGSVARGSLLRMRAQTRRFALVIGSNATLDAAQAPLRFADDDAARMAELFEEIGADVEVVTSLDRDTQAIHVGLVARAHAPTPKGLDEAWKALRTRMEAAKADGAVVELLIFYSGHGDVGPDGQGYLTLRGGKLTRKHLFGKLLTSSVADHNHVIIDACRSEHFVLSRGKGWKPDRRPVDASADVRRYLDRTHLGAFPNTGVVVAHSADQQTHEWERYRGGIFSHELMSGLRGGADLNGDGNIEYSELGAFVSAANSGVDDPRARLSVTVRPPADDERHPVVVHRDLAAQRVLLFLQPDPSLYTVEDARGVRLADLRRTTDQPAYLRLPAGPLFIARQTEAKPPVLEETALEHDDEGVILASRLEFSPRQGAARGALDQAFRRGLFATPFGPGYYAGYTDQNGLLGVQDPTWRDEQWPSQPKDEPTQVAQPEPPAEDAAEPENDRETTETTIEAVPWWMQGTTWGGVFVGTSITPFNPQGRIELDPRRVTSNQFRGCLVPRKPDVCSALRGFDLRWQIFRTKPGKKYPRTLWYFRTGYSAGHASFYADDMDARDNDQATELGYLTVPLFLGGNIYLFDSFPVRPYAGLGFGFDVLRVDYKRVAEPSISDVSARIGFELHAGIEARITNWVALTAEVQQLWSARKKVDTVPDFSNEGFTIITGVAIGFPIHDPPRTKTVRRKKAAR